MKAVICKKSGGPNVLELKKVEKPFPKPDEILVKIYASSVTRGDVLLRTIPRFILIPMGYLFGFKAMEITGVEFAGEVEETGRNVEQFKKGDRVFGTTTGLKYGGNAEYVCVPEQWKRGEVTKMPTKISFCEAAVVPVGGMTALDLLNKANITSDKSVLIYGASGSVGSYAVQIAKYFGAHVAAVCSAKNTELVRSLRADRVIDYTKDDFTKMGEKYDVIFDAVGKKSKWECKSVMKENGSFHSVNSRTKETTEYLVFLRVLLEKGKLRPVIDRYYPLDMIAEAHRYVEQGHKRGNVVITL